MAIEVRRAERPRRWMDLICMAVALRKSQFRWIQEEEINLERYGCGELHMLVIVTSSQVPCLTVSVAIVTCRCETRV